MPSPSKSTKAAGGSARASTSSEICNGKGGAVLPVSSNICRLEPPNGRGGVTPNSSPWASFGNFAASTETALPAAPSERASTEKRRSEL